MCTGEGAKHTVRVPYSLNLNDEQVQPSGVCGGIGMT